MKLQSIGSALIALFFTGCAGYNHTMFMTKSNAGLDFDAKPPTVEVSISRKEAVIAPSFEGGQTPPVMASFKPHSGVGSSFLNFFLGVDQTFAGGDAAVAMSQLYNNRTPPISTKDSYNSAIFLTKPPQYKNCFQAVPGAGETRALIFGTDTTLGLKAAWSGVGGQIPDTVKLGFNRKEFAWAPLSTTNHGNDLYIKMPSFLATIESEDGVKTNHEVSVQALQYFATGDAAVYLAMQRDVRAAMLARLDPNEQQFKQKFNDQAQSVLGDLLFNVSKVLGDFKDTDGMARELLATLDKLEGLQLPDEIYTDVTPLYSFYNNALKKNEPAKAPLGKKLADVGAYFDILKKSLSNLNAAFDAYSKGQNLTFTDMTQDKSGNNKKPIDNATMRALTDENARLSVRFNELKTALASNPSVVDAFNYANRLIAPR